MDNYLEIYREEIDAIVEVCHRDGELGFGPAVSGNISYRVADDIVLITPTKTPKRLIRPEDICVIDMKGNPISIPEGKAPTGETYMHLHILELRPDIKAVFHAHPPLATGLSTTDNGKRLLRMPIIPEAMMLLGPVLTVPYADPNMMALAEAFNDYAIKSNAFLLESHGALVCSSKNVLETIELMQILEALAQTILTAQIMGTDIRSLTREDIAGIDETIRELGWDLAGAPGYYQTIQDMFPMD